MPDNDLKRRIEQLVDEHREQIVTALSELIRFETVSGASDQAGQERFREETRRCLEYLGKLAEQMGLQWRNYEDQVAVAAYQSDGRFIGIPVHIDVVPPGDGWTREAFGGAVEEGYVWGRGCQDDKGPVVQMLWALGLLKQLELEPRRGAKLIIGTVEECGDWSDIRRYFDHEPEPEACIVPDATFPIINGEKGMMNLLLQARIASDGSPAVGGYRLRSASGGERSNMVPSKAQLVFSGDSGSDPSHLRSELDRFLHSHPKAKAEAKELAASHEVEITFYGTSAHGSTPEQGHNAVLDMLLFMTQSGFVADDEADMAQFLYNVGSDTRGGFVNIAEQHAFVGATTLNLGILQWNDEAIQAVLNIRNTLGLTGAEVVQRVSRRVEAFGEETGFDIDVSTHGKALEPIYVDPSEHADFIQALQEAYSTFTGRDPALHAIGGTTYAKVFPRAVCFGPVDLEDEPELAHKADERLRIEHLLRNVKIYAYAVAKLCCTA